MQKTKKPQHVDQQYIEALFADWTGAHNRLYAVEKELLFILLDLELSFQEAFPSLRKLNYPYEGTNIPLDRWTFFSEFATGNFLYYRLLSSFSELH